MRIEDIWPVVFAWKRPRRIAGCGARIENLEPRVLLSVAAPTTAVVTANQNPSHQGDDVRFTGVFSSTAGPVDTTGRTVTWVSDGRPLVDQFPSGNTFPADYENLKGTHSITISFSGNADFGPSTSPPFIQTVLAPQPDLIADSITGILLQTSFAAGGRIGRVGTVSIGNEGAGTGGGHFSVNLFLSADDVLDAGDAPLGSASATLPHALYSGITFTAHVKLQPLPRGAAGSYDILAQTVGGGGPTEVNPVYYGLMVTAPVVALGATLSAVPETAKPGENASVTLELQNSGNVSGTGLLTIDFFEEAPGTDGTPLGSWKGHVRLAPGHAQRLRARFRVSSAATAGSSLWIARVDRLMAISTVSVDDAVSTNPVMIV